MTVFRLAGCLLVFTVVACADRGTIGATGGTLIIAVPSAWTPGPPPVVVDALSRAVSDQLYERLAEIGARLNTIGDAGFTPRLARSWTWARDSLSIAFSIDPRARWHDGRPVGASDVRFTLAVHKDPNTGSSLTPLLENVDSVTIRDSLTAVAWFHRRTPEQFYDLVFQMFVMPEHIWKDVPRDRLATSDAARAPIGSGRFRFVRFEPGVLLEIVADTANYRGRAKLDRIVWSIVPDGAAAVTQLLSGQADLFEFLPPDVVARVDSNGPVRAVKYPGLGYTYMGFNTRDRKRRASSHPVLGDARVRRALSMALDRRAMLVNVFDTLGTLGSGPYPGALADTTVTPPPFDRGHASALLDSAGWAEAANGVRRKNGQPLAFSLIVPTSSRTRMRYAVLIQEQLKAIGTSVAIESMEFAAFNERQMARAFDAALMSTAADPSAAAVKQSWATSGTAKGGQNYVSYSNPAFDVLIDSALATFDEARARAYARRAYQLLVDDAPAVWLYDVLTIAGVHRRVHPEGMRADVWWANLADWWIAGSDRIERDRIGLRSAVP